MRQLLVLVGLIALTVTAPTQARAQAGDVYSVVGAESVLTYHLIHKLHKIDGVSKKVEGKGRILPDGQAQVMIRVPVESFDSGNVNRDAHMKETVEAARFPHVELKAMGLVAPPTVFPTTVEKVWKAQLTFHGVTQTLEIPVKLIFEAANRIKAMASFPVSLEAFKVERPSLMFVKVDDALKLDAAVVLSR